MSTDIFPDFDFVSDHSYAAKLISEQASPFHSRTSINQKSTFGPLFTAIQGFKSLVHKESPSFDFRADLLPKILRWASDERYHGKKIPLLHQGTAATVKLASSHIRYLLANVFLLNDQYVPYDTYGNIHLGRLFSAPLPVGVQRIICFLCYFYSSPEEDDNEITFERVILTDAPDWKKLDTRISDSVAQVHQLRMEDLEGSVFTDFANQQLSIGSLIPSATQEEILFSLAPECLPSMFLFERLQSDEVAIIRNVRRIADYQGYLSSFEVTKLINPPGPSFDVVAIDSVYLRHFQEESVIRDMNKAYLGFLESARPHKQNKNNDNDNEKRVRIITGNWGCGAFRGDQAHKFVQQICAAAAAGVELEYSTFTENNTVRKQILKLMQGKTVGEIVKKMLMFSQKEKFQDYFLDVLNE
eukprot:TRINITY_DN14767_c0_g1_i1.p1 TRINITY_DN14767_c0_g1~~TRINITY_DN14767_c0_g1_i1.p1  ORF type:complete len:414 (-),score=74.51 TRINITY_DN14767_c0_g1_i1:90-1331(-)